MQPCLFISSVLQQDKTGKLHSAVLIVLLLLILGALFSYSKWKRRGSPEYRRRLQTETIGQAIWRNFLELVDMFVGFYLRRGPRKEEPFRKATDWEKRSGAGFMIVFPASMAFVTTHAKSIDAFINPMLNGAHWIGWFYITWMALVAGGGLLVFVVAPKIPLKISVPLAVLAWLTMGWVIWTHDLI